MHNILETNFDKLTGDPTLEELSTEEVVNALNVLETIDNGLRENFIKELTEDQVKQVFNIFMLKIDF